MSTKSKKAGAGKFLALLASLAMVIAGLTSIALASPASATQPDPEHQVTICHPVEGKGETGNGYNVITVDEASWKADEDAGKGHNGDKLWNSETKCGQSEQEECEKDGHHEWRDGDGHECRTKYEGSATSEKSIVICMHNDGNYDRTITGNGDAKATSYKSQSDADEKAQKAADKEALEDIKDQLKEINPKDYTKGACDSEEFTADATATATTTICFDGQTTDVSADGWGYATSEVSQEAADEAALANAKDDAQANLDDLLAEEYEGYTEGACQTPDNPQTFSKGLATDVCIDGAPQTLTVVGQGPSEGAAQGDADSQMDQKISSLGATVGSCPTVAAAVVETPAGPNTVAAPAAATVAKPAKAPAKVTVPAAATLPAAVPAGDGSKAPGLPLWAIALVVVGVIGAAATGKQLLGARK